MDWMLNAVIVIGIILGWSIAFILGALVFVIVAGVW
jgi:hypothetical protein